MTSEITEAFRNCLRELPDEVRALARRTYFRGPTRDGPSV
jgi:hypothetical protein